jgi:hypothetical protein
VTHSSSSTQTSVGTADSGGGSKSRVSVMVSKWDQGTLTVEDRDGRRTATVKDAQDKVVFEGPIDTPEQKAKLPPEAREHLERIDAELKPDQLPRHQIEEIRVLEPSPAPTFTGY